MAEGGCELVDPLTLSPPKGDPADSSNVVESKHHVKTKAEIGRLSAQLKSLNLNSSVEINDKTKSLDSSFAPSDFRFSFDLGKDHSAAAVPLGKKSKVGGSGGPVAPEPCNISKGQKKAKKGKKSACQPNQPVSNVQETLAKSEEKVEGTDNAPGSFKTDEKSFRFAPNDFKFNFDLGKDSLKAPVKNAGSGGMAKGNTPPNDTQTGTSSKKRRKFKKGKKISDQQSRSESPVQEESAVVEDVPAVVEDVPAVVEGKDGVDKAAGSFKLDENSGAETVSNEACSKDTGILPPCQGKAKTKNVGRLAAQLKTLKLNSSVEIDDRNKSSGFSSTPSDFKFNFQVKNNQSGVLAKKSASNVSVEKSGVLDSGSEGEGKFTEVRGEGKKKKSRRGKRAGKKKSKKLEGESCVVHVLEEETSFTILPKSDVKEMVREMNGMVEVASQNRGRESDGKSSKTVKSKVKLAKGVIADVVSNSKNDEIDNSVKLKSKNVKLPGIVDSGSDETVSVAGLHDGGASPRNDEVGKVTASKKRRERRKKQNQSKNVALLSLLNKDPKDLDDDSDELPELVRQFLEKNRPNVESTKGSGKAKASPQHAGGKPDKSKRNTEKIPVKEGCYTKLLREHSIRERHDSLPDRFDRRRGSSPLSCSPAERNRNRSYSQSNGEYDLFREARQSPRQGFFRTDLGNHNRDSPKKGRKGRKNKERAGTPDSQESGQRRRNTIDYVGEESLGQHLPRNGMSPAGPSGQTTASPGPRRRPDQRQNMTPFKGDKTPKKQTPTPRSVDGRNTHGNTTPKTPNNQTRGTPRSASAKKEKLIQFDRYLSKDEISTRLKRGEIIQGAIRINPKNYEDAYVPHPDQGQDVYIKGLRDRNRALNGDIVVVQVLPGDKTPLVDANQEKNLPPAVQEVLGRISEKNANRRGKVVGIVEKQHSRACTGHIKLMKDKNPDVVLFSPIDHRLPRIKVPMSDCPKGFKERPGDYATTLFVARITEWNETSQFASGSIHRSLGEAGEIEPETEGMLNDYGVDYSDFSPDVLECLPSNLPWRIPESEYEIRKDLRKEVIFTIDPATARDLDDALSCVDNGDGTYEIGVHIADVSYFVKEFTDLDHVAASRATSVYLVQKVVPMLPRLLCEQLCSLNPDEDRLTFSVMWKMTETGEIRDIWFGRSVIRSCVKLSYDHAQGFLDEPEREWTTDELPPISDGVSIDDIKSRICILDRIAKNLRAMRADNGALRLDQVKLSFVLDKESGLPCGWNVYHYRDSNKLIEEFMLLANMSVANKIHRSFPEKAMLRCHPPPHTKMIQDVEDLCKTLDIPLDASSSQALQESLHALYGDDEESQSRLQVLTALCSKPMQLAKYFCTGTVTGQEDCWHYALSVPEYTHFTSPIRRYPDVIVHRQLAAALELTPEPQASTQSIQKLADHCNVKKSNAKKVSEMSIDMFFAIFVKESGPLEESGMVMSVMDHSFDVLILKFGVTKRVYTNKLKLLDTKFERKNKVPQLTLVWKGGEQMITLFTKVDCIVEADRKPNKWNVLIKSPVCDEPSAPAGAAGTAACNDVSNVPKELLKRAVVADGDGDVLETGDGADDDESDSEDTSDGSDDVVVEETIEVIVDDE